MKGSVIQMNLQIVNRQRTYKKEQLRTYERIMEQIFQAVGESVALDLRLRDVRPMWTVTVFFVGDDAIKRINAEHRGIRKTTDVLSFPLLSMEDGDLAKPLQEADFFVGRDERETLHLGEILICLSQAGRQALEYGHTMERETGFLFLHGLLHLLGFDHENSGDEEKMIDLQEMVLDGVGIGKGKNVTGQSSSLPEPFRLEHVGFVAVIGRPNVGKSTFINYLSGMKLAIVSSKPQTTRTRIRSVLNSETSQIIFLDTPGIHTPKTALSDHMVRTAFQAAEEGDVILLIADAARGMPSSVEREICNLAAKSKKKLVLALNKADAVKKESLLPLIRAYSDLYAFVEIVPISARTGDGMDRMISILESLLPAGYQLYDAEETTDQSERMLAAELIREQLLFYLNDEIPYGTAVEIESFTDKYGRDDSERNLVRIQAAIYCDKDTHKGMILGKKGQMIQKIGRAARENIEEMCGCKVYLELFVKVRENWKNKENFLKTLGYSGNS